MLQDVASTVCVSGCLTARIFFVPAAPAALFQAVVEKGFTRLITIDGIKKKRCLFQSSET